MNNLSEKGMRKDKKDGALSSASVEYHYRILKSIFKFAVTCKMLKESPLEGVEKPKTKHKEINVYDEKQVSQLMRCLENEPLKWQVLIKLAFSAAHK